MMKVKNLFSNRRTKKKKNQATSSTPETSVADRSDKLIIPTAECISGSAIAKENEMPIRGVEPCPELQPAQVVLRRKTKQMLESRDSLGLNDSTKTRASSTSSNGSGRGKSRRPWSFIDQMRKQDSRESAYSPSSSVRTSQVVEDLVSYTPPPKYDDAISTAKDSMERGRANTVALTLPRSLTPEIFSNHFHATTKQSQSSKRKTIDFRFFNFFRRSADGAYPESSGANPLGNTSRSSVRSKNRGKKKQGSKKKKDLEETKSHDSITDDSRIRSSSDTFSNPLTLKLDEETLQNPPPGLYDSDSGCLNAVVECAELAVDVADKRVPVNGEPAAEFATSSHDRLSFPSLTNATYSASVKHQRRSDPTGGHSMLRMQFSEAHLAASGMTRSASDSADVPSRRSSTACERRELPLPEDSIANFDSSAYIGQRYKMLHSGGSVPHLAMKLPAHRIHRTQSNDVPKESLSRNRKCSQSVINLPSVAPNNTTLYQSDNDISEMKSIIKPGPIRQRIDHSPVVAMETISTSCTGAPSSPVLRAIGYPGVILRRDRESFGRRRPTDQRAKLVMSLNVEDLPTYHSEPRFDRVRVSAYPSCEDILSESRSASKMHSGSRYSGTARSHVRRRGHTTHGLSAGSTNAVSVEDLDSLSSSNFGSKQSLLQLDDDENLNAMLARRQHVTHTSSNNLRIQEPSLKKAKAIRKSVASLANLISPGKPNQKSKLQRSSSFKESGLSTPASSSTAAARSFKPYKPPSNTPNKKNRRSKLWCETFDHSGLAEGEVRRQEAIYELYQGERDLVEDLTMAKQTYRDSMVTLKMLSDEEVTLIFGKLGCLLPLHEELLAKLEQARGEDGKTLAIGCIFVEWFPRISTAYQEYCSNQSDAKYALDAAVERDARVRDFLQRCLASPFSRKLDLWSYLDLPRTRLVKYPLLLQNILKRTPQDLEIERDHLSKVLDIIGNIIEKVDGTTGEQQCRYVRSKMEYLDEKHKSAFVENSRLMLCSGQLKNNRGTKMNVFLFEAALVLTRQTTRANTVRYQVYRNPLPLRSLVVDVNEGEKLSGSFRGGILSSDKVKHSFRVRSEELNVVYTLQASDEHDKKQWINALQDALTKYRTRYPGMVMDNIEFHAVSKRRATYDPSSKKNGKSRQVNRTSSDKSNASATSSSDKSSTLDESQDDVSTASEDATTWGRTRSQTVNVLNAKAKASSSVSRNSSASSTRSDDSSSSAGVEKEDAKHKERLRNLATDGIAPKSLRSSLRKKSLTRHFSLGKGDKTKGLFPLKAEFAEKERQKCQRSKSLNSPPQIGKSVSSRYLSKKLGSENVVTAAKPPIAPSSPFVERRSALCPPSEILHQAKSTPDLTKIVSNETLSGDSAAHQPQMSSLLDAKDDLAQNIASKERHAIDVCGEGAISSHSETIDICNHNDSIVTKIVISDVTDCVNSSQESTAYGNTCIDKGLSDIDDNMAGPCASSDEASLDTLIAVSDSGLDATASIDCEEIATLSETLVGDPSAEHELNAEHRPSTPTYEGDTSDSPLAQSVGNEESDVPTECTNDHEEEPCDVVIEPVGDLPIENELDTETEHNIATTITHEPISQDTRDLTPVAHEDGDDPAKCLNNSKEDDYVNENTLHHVADENGVVVPTECMDENKECDSGNMNDEPTVIAKVESEQNYEPCNESEGRRETSSQGDESEECNVQENDLDDKKYCRSEIFEENLSAQNSNIQTAT